MIIAVPWVLLLAGCMNSVRKAGNEAVLHLALITVDIPAEVVDGFNAWQLYGTVPKDWVDYRTFNDGSEFRFFKKGNLICIVSQVYGWRNGACQRP